MGERQPLGMASCLDDAEAPTLPAQPGRGAVGKAGAAGPRETALWITGKSAWSHHHASHGPLSREIIASPCLPSPLALAEVGELAFEAFDLELNGASS